MKWRFNASFKGGGGAACPQDAAVIMQPIRKTRFCPGPEENGRGCSCERQPLDFARGPDPFDSAQGHPEPACGEPVEPVERMSLPAVSLSNPSNGRADGRFQIHSLALVATNQMLFPKRRARRKQRVGMRIRSTKGNEEPSAAPPQPNSIHGVHRHRKAPAFAQGFGPARTHPYLD
jgi:hypothetical protein